MTDRPTITAALITLNEESNLRELLPRLDWVDEIVVVDGGSSDRTVHVARLHGARVFERPFRNFCEQRNEAIRMARSDWVLSIDADERPTRTFVKEALSRVCGARERAFRVPIHSTIFGRRFRFSGTQDDRPIRLFRRGYAYWIRDVHEVLRVRGFVGSLRAPLTHVTYPDLSSFLMKVGRYTSLEAAARVAAGRAPRRYEPWLCPAREILRRLFWKQGCLDGPEGWAFCLLSGLSEWVACDKHRRLWRHAHRHHAVPYLREARAA